MNNFDIDNLNMNLLLALRALLSERNVTLAGEKLGISQSAMSHYLKQLRLHYQDKLLVKGKNNILILTPLANSLLMPLENLYQGINEIFYPDPNFIPNKTKIKFNIAMPDYIAMVLLPPLMKRIKHLAPNASIIVHSLNHIHDIEEFESKQLDLAIGMYTKPPLALKKQLLFSDQAICISCQNNKDIKEPIDLESFLRLPQVLVGYKPNEDSIYINKILHKETKNLDISLITPYTIPALHIIPNSPFVTITLKKIASKYRDILKLRLHTLPFNMKPYKASQYWHEKNQKANAQVWLRQIVREVSDALEPDI